jgi:hypothetical protein
MGKLPPEKEPDPNEPDPNGPDPNEPDQLARPIEHWLVAGPTPRPQPWLRFVNREEDSDELARLRQSVIRGSPFGDDAWRVSAARKLGLESTLRARGRPKRNKK